MMPGMFAGGAGSSGGDPYWANVSALLHMDGSNGSTTFTDETGKTWTPNDNVQISTAQAKFGQSALFDGTSDWIDGPSSADFTFGTGDFTLECFVYFTASGANLGVISFGGNLTIYLASTFTNIYFFDGVSANVVQVPAPTLNAWHHVALTRQSGTLRIFCDGVAGTSASFTNDITSTNMRIGASTTGGTHMLGYIDELRITKGVSRYNAGFTPPAAPFPNF